MLWRRIWFRFLTRKGGGRRVVSNTSFKDDAETEPMSVVIATPGRDPREILTQQFVGPHNNPAEFGVVGFTVGLARSLGLRVARSDAPNEPDHAYVIGEKSPDVSRALRTQSQWIVKPPEYEDVSLQ
jgi:hypothetical protein